MVQGADPVRTQVKILNPRTSLRRGGCRGPDKPLPGGRPASLMSCASYVRRAGRFCVSPRRFLVAARRV